MKKFSLFSATLFVVIVLSCISCGYLFSNFLIAADAFNTTIVTIDKQTIFVLSVFESEDKSDLISMQSELKANGKAGVIFEKDNKFYLLADAFENKADGEKVKTNLMQYENCKLLKIEFEKQKYEGSFSADEKKILTECLQEKFEIFKKLFNISVSLDTNIIDEKKAKSMCNDVFSCHIKTKTNFETYFDKSKFENIENYLQNTTNLLSKLIENDKTNQNFFSFIKETYINILFKK